MEQVLNALPDDKPITSIIIIEGGNKCPVGFIPINRTYDADSDADLAKERFFGGKVMRYLCISKTNQQSNFVLEDLIILNEKERPPAGYGVLSTEPKSKVSHKKQIYCKWARQEICQNYISDLIILSKTKSAPEGFTYLGEINNLTLCYKRTSARLAHSVLHSSSRTSLYPINPLLNGEHDTKPLPSPPKTNGTDSSPVYENTSLSKQSSTSYKGVQGVPFVLNSRLQRTSNISLAAVTSIKTKTKEEIEAQYRFDLKL